MSVLVYLEHSAGEVDEPSLQALTLARAYGGGSEVQAVAACDDAVQAPLAALADHGVSTLHVAEGDVFASYAPQAIAEAIVELAGRLGAAAVVGPGTERGNEVMAHAAALLDVPLAANCITAAPSEGGADVTRVRWGGSLLEVARLHAPVALMTVQPHGVAIETAAGDEPALETFAPSVSDAATAIRVTETVGASAGGISLADAKVVVSGGRGAGSTEGFGVVEELAGLLGGGRRLLAGRDDGRMEAAHRPGRADGDEDRARGLHRVRYLRGDAAHGRLQGREADPGDQRRPRGADPRERRLCRDRRHARDPSRGERGAPRGTVVSAG